MGRPNALSQRSNHPCRKDDNANITLLPSNVFEVHNTEATLVDSGGDELGECIQRNMDYNDAVVKALQELGAGTLQLDEWERDGDLVMYRGCVYVPKDLQLCHDIVHAHHDSMMTGHPGWWKTLELVSHNYWWLGISHYVASYVEESDACNRCKSFQRQKEQVNQEIEAYLRVFVSHHQDDWADWLPLAEFAYNNRIHSATRHTPFELDSGQHPQMGLEPTRSSAVEATDDFAQ